MVKPTEILLNRGPTRVNGIGNDIPQIFEFDNDTRTTAMDMLSRKNSHRAYVEILRRQRPIRRGCNDIDSSRDLHGEDTPDTTLARPDPDGQVAVFEVLANVVRQTPV